jgi:flavin reductase (DIM6/NTAB) family NADH-FMN oxidoreductase RutF
MKVVPGEISTGKLHAYMLGSIAPRPIAFASTIDKNGIANLSPFSFFNTFGSNPPILIFSPARRVRDNSIKHTLENVKEVPEVVINMVNYKMVQQMSLASCEYPKGTDEFIKAGFTPFASEKVKPFGVAESPVNIECKVKDIIETGHEGGAGNLIVSEIVMMHIKDEVLDAEGRIDPHKIDLVARMGADFYCRASGNAVFEVQKPNLKLGIGIDNLPAQIRNSKILSGNDLGMLANVEAVPTIDLSFQFNGNNHHEVAQQLLQQHKVNEAWQVLLREK